MRSTPSVPDGKASLIARLIGPDAPGDVVWSPRDYASFAREGFMQNAVVYRSVRMVAEAAATIPLLVYDGDIEIENSDIAALIAAPNDSQTGTDLLEAWYGYLLVAGNAYLEAVTVDERVRELHVLRPDRMRVVAGSDGWPVGYEYTAAGKSVRFSQGDTDKTRSILHLKMFHPANDHYGMSPIEAAAVAIDIHNTASGWNKALLDNSARPSGALVYGQAGGHMTDEQFGRLKSELEANYQGAAHAGRPMLLEGGLDWKPLSLSPKDLDFVAAKNAAAREIALAIGVPPMLLGIPGDNTYSDDPYDPGGPTNMGITLAVFARWRKTPVTDRTRSQLVRDLKKISMTIVRDIYRNDYWTPAQCQELTPALALMHFDSAVNHGVGTAIRLLQGSLGVAVDGEIGPETRAAIARANVAKLIATYAERRRVRYRQISTFWRFGRGWLRRVDDTLAEARQLLKSVPSLAAPAAGDVETTGKDEVMREIEFGPTGTQSDPPSGKWWGHSKTIWGTLITVASTVLPVVGPLIGIELPSDVIKDIGEKTLHAVQVVGALIGTLLAIYGRINASEPITRRQISLKL